MKLKVIKDLHISFDTIDSMYFRDVYALFYGLSVLDGSLKPTINLTKEEKTLIDELSNIDMNKFLGK